MGQTLNGSYTYSDADSDAEGASTFQWYRDDMEISGATAKAYTLVAADEGKSIKFEVTPVSMTGEPKVGIPTKSAATAPVVLALPSIQIRSLSTEGEPDGVLLADGAPVRVQYQWSSSIGAREGATRYEWQLVGGAVFSTDKAPALPSLFNGNGLSGMSRGEIMVKITPVDEFGNEGASVISNTVLVRETIPSHGHTEVIWPLVLEYTDVAAVPGSIDDACSRIVPGAFGPTPGYLPWVADSLIWFSDAPNGIAQHISYLSDTIISIVRPVNIGTPNQEYKAFPEDPTPGVRDSITWCASN
ncbi:hypothetical protein DBR09_11565 [Aeromonas sp. HMWF016]|nr:hypothetical protein DBR09_11565 [Aeromonas sp. HMWF016]